MLDLVVRLTRAAARAIVGPVRFTLIPAMAWVISLTRSHRRMLSVEPEGEIALESRVAVFCHFDRAGAVRDHVLHYVRTLHGAGISVVFVTNSGKLTEAARAAIAPFCAMIMVRANSGYDFGAWREALERIALPRADTSMLLMINDSLYGPLRALDQTIAQIDFAKADVWGLTESYQNRYHLQSYFLAFGPTVLADPSWSAFWSRVRPVPSKQWVIKRYEVGLTQEMIRAGFRCRAVWAYPALLRDIDETWTKGGDTQNADDEDPMITVRRRHARQVREAAARRQPVNPTSDLWRQLLQAGFPFIKRELLRDNRGGVHDVTDWRDLLQDMGLDTSQIDRDLQRALRNRAP